MSANGGNIVVQLQLEDGQFKVATINAGSLMRDFKRQVDSTATSVKRLETQQMSVGRQFRDLVLTLGNLRFVAMDINDIFLRLPMAILKSAGELERMRQLMTGLSKETETLKRNAEGMRNFGFVTGMAKNAPFEIGALSDAFVKLKTAGIDPTNGSMQAMVDAVARFGGTGDTLKRATVAIQQMAGKGVISMEELRQQLGEAVPTAMQAMAEGMNMSMAKLAKVVSTGTLAAGPALEKMLLRMRIENAEAAAEMMNTWVGMNARLKTEWDLTAAYIAENGFGDAAKSVVRDLTNALQSDDFRKFGAEFGQGLGTVVRDLIALTKVVVEYRDELGLLVKGWLAYKLVFSVIAPMGKALEESLRGTARSMADQSRELRAFGAAKAEEALNDARIAANNASIRATALSEKLATDQKELASVKARNAAIIADDARKTAALAAMRRAEAGGAINYSSQEAAKRDLTILAQKNFELNNRQKELARSIAETTVASNNANAVWRKSVVEYNNVANAQQAMSLAARAAEGAQRALTGAMNLLGGPVGVAIISIGLLVTWWMKVKQAAEDAKQAQVDAANGAATAKQADSLREQSDAAAKELQAARAAIGSGTMIDGAATAAQRRQVFRQKTEAERAADRDRLSRAEAEDRRLYELSQKARLTVEEQGAEQRATNSMRAVDRELRDMESANNQRMRQLAKEKDAKLSTFKKDSAEFLKERERFGKQEAAQLKQSEEARLAVVQKNLQQTRAKGDSFAVGSAGRIEADKTAAQLEERARALKASIDGINNAVNGPVVINKDPKDGKGAGGKESPIQRLIENLGEQRAGLMAELEGFDEVEKKGDRVQAAIAKLWAQIENGDFNTGKDKKTKPTADQINKALQAAVDKAVSEGDLAEVKKRAEDLAKVTSFIKGQEPEIQAAMELLADPLGTATRGRNEKRASTMLAGNEEGLKAYAEKVGKTIAQVTKEVMDGARLIDDSNTFSEIAQQTKQLNDGLVDDSRQAARARAAADNERHRQAIQNIIDLRKASGLSTEEVAKLQETLNNNTVARANDLSQRFKSPLEKLAENWSNSTRAMEEASAGWLNSTADKMTEFVMTGKANFADLARSIIADLIKIQIQKAIAGAVSAATSFFGFPSFFADGGIMSAAGSMPLKKYAAGGVANSPQMAVFGEGDMPEAYVPLPDGRTIPVTMKGGGAGGSNVEININIHKGGGSTTETKGDEAGQYKQLGERVKQVVREEIQNQSRPGGMLYK